MKEEKEKVKGIVQRFMELTFRELKSTQYKDRPYIQCCVEPAIAVEELDEALAENMDYTDICVLVENIRENTLYSRVKQNGRRVDNKIVQLFAYKMLQHALMDADKASCVRVRLFMALKLRDFYEYLDSVNPEGELKLEYELICGIITNVFAVKDCSEYTIMDALKLCREQMEKVWLPMGDDSIAMYERKIMEAHFLVGRILVKSFGFAFEERFELEVVRSKYTL